MAKSQILLRMNHFHNASYANWLVLILCLLRNNVAYSQTQDDKDTKIFLEKLDTTKFNHLVVDKDQGFVFIGAVDLLYQLSSDLELVASWRQDNSSLKCDDFENASNGMQKSIGNYNKILVLDYTASPSQLISCWSTCDGLCKIYRVENPLRETNTVIEPIVSRDENASTVAFTVSDPDQITPLYVGVTITTGHSKVPAISRKIIEEYFADFSSGDGITLKDVYRGKYIINYIYGFSSGHFIYFLTTQMNSTQPSLYKSKLVRGCQRISFSFSYTEIPIECYDEIKGKYNLAQAAFIGKPGSKLADSLGITAEDDVLFGIFAQSKNQTEGYESSKPSNRSAMCIYSLKEINEKFFQNIQRCYNGTGYRGLEFIISPDLKCEKMNILNDPGFCGSDINMPMEGNSPVKTNASIIFDTLVTAVHALSYSNNFTAVFAGTNTGHLKQIVVENTFNAYECKDMAIDEGFAINSDLHFDSKTDHLYIMTEQKLTKMKISILIPSISSFQPTLAFFGDIINVTILGNNLACSSNDTQHTRSITVAGIPCTTCRPLHSAEIVCTINTSGITLAERKEYVGPIEIRVDCVMAKSEQNFIIIDPKTERKDSLYGGNDWIIYGLCFGAFILIIIFLALIKLLIAYRKKSFKSLKTSKEMQRQINRMGMDAIAMRQCMKQIVVEKKIDVDGSLANILKLPNITIAYTPVTETTVETAPDTEFYLPLDTKWEFPREKLVLGRFLGEGEFGRVVQSEASGIVDENITTVAVKMLKVKHSDADMIDLVSEMEIMKLIGTHPNVLRLLGCCTQNGPLLIITEYAVHGNLLSFLHKHVASENFETTPSKPSQRTLVTFGLQVARGMEYLSSMKCVHRDLAARNILVSDNQILKIADFGLARDIKSKDYYRKKSGGRLPVKWMAPEALLRRLYTVQSDVWSYGILLWEIMTLGGSPYPTFTDMKKLLRDLHSGYRMEKPPDCSMEMYSIMRQCWNYLPTDRPSFSVIVENLEEILQNSGDNDILEESDSCESSSIDSECSETDNEALEGDHLLSISPQ
ncbi:uncharacterized protein LOC135843932 [Planococcus citri]|uniref:uncharacterized protein LOC135843932 n=1 Tax=Planococcus citri TaxID=170843 RepID=UPI0031F7C88E